MLVHESNGTIQGDDAQITAHSPMPVKLPILLCPLPHSEDIESSSPNMQGHGCAPFGPQAYKNI